MQTTMVGLLEALSGIAIILVGFYYYATFTYNFWANRGVFGPKPVPMFGNFTKIMTTKSTKAVVLKELYYTYMKEPIVGIYDKRQPALLVRDPAIFREIFTENFATFPERGIAIYEKAEPFTLDLFCLDAKRWRSFRQNLSPGFASGRFKEMFQMIASCADLLDKHLDDASTKGLNLACRDVFSRYTVNVIGTCAFGVDLNVLEDEHSLYHEMCESAFKIDANKFVRNWLKTILPWFYDTIGYVLPYSKTLKFFRNTVRDTIEYRKKNNVTKRDFINQLQLIKEKPELLGPDIQLTDVLLAAQAFVFFTAGFEASAITLTNIFYELAQHPEIQQKLREEIQQEIAKNNGILQFESINQLKYLHKVFRETLRKHPPVKMILRKSIRSHTFQNVNLTIPKDIKIFVSVTGVHHDPSIYPNPEIFDPERFSDEKIASRHPMAFLPFGIGPRMCIGARLANYVVKVGICKMLLKYQFDACAQTDIPYKEDPSSFLLTPLSEIYLKVSKID